MLSIAATLAIAAFAPTSREVSFTGAGGLELKGTFEAPTGAMKVPGFLLIPGSGPTDRNGSSGPLKIELLKQIADYLADHGVATLRFDKRAVATYIAQWPKDVAAQNDFFDWPMLVGDAKAALGYLRTQPEVDAARTGLVGHSEGGLISLQIASDTAGKPDAPAAIILLGTAGRKLDLVIHQQIAEALAKSGLPETTSKEYIDYTDRAMAQLAKDSTLPPNCPPGLAALFPPSGTKLMHAYFITDPAKLAAAYGGPVLLMSGERDTQVSATADFPVLKAVFEKRKSATFDSLLVPNASHNFKTLSGPADPALEGPVAPVALDKLGSWIKSIWKS